MIVSLLNPAPCVLAALGEPVRIAAELRPGVRYSFFEAPPGASPGACKTSDGARVRLVLPDGRAVLEVSRGGRAATVVSFLPPGEIP